MKYLEYTQYFDEYAIPNVSPPNAGTFYLVIKVINLLWKEDTCQIIIYLIQCMLTFHHIKYKK